MKERVNQPINQRYLRHPTDDWTRGATSRHTIPPRSAAVDLHPV